MNTNTKKYEKIIRKLAGDCLSKDNKTTYYMEHVNAVNKECQCFVHRSGYYMVCLYNKVEYDLQYSTETQQYPVNRIIPADLFDMKAPTFSLKEKTVESVHKEAKAKMTNKDKAPLCKIGEAYFNTDLLRQVVRVLGDSKIIVLGQVKTAFLISEIGIGVLYPIRVKGTSKDRAVEIA